VSPRRDIEDLLRDAAPQVLAAVVRRFGDFADAEDAVQEAMLAAAQQWPRQGSPDNPVGWLIQVASRRMIDQARSETARRDREALAAAQEPRDLPPAADHDDTLALMFMSCHPELTPASAIALTLRAVGGLTTTEIANAFLVPEATMAQRISRAKQTIKASAIPFGMPSGAEWAERLRSVLHALYLIFNEGYLTSGGPELARSDLSGEAIRLARIVRRALPDDPEVAGLLALMLLTEARRPARTGANGELITLAEQDRSRWDRDLIAEGLGLLATAWSKGSAGEYLVQAQITALHDQAARYEDTDWRQIAALYGLLERITGNPLVSLNRAIAVAMVEGPPAGLALLEPLEQPLAGHHRLHAIRAHLLEMAGDVDAAIGDYETAARRTSSIAERNYLTMRAARLTGARHAQQRLRQDRDHHDQPKRDHRG
jgi:RNA polymerase sigma factor (sigma-70 family)